MEDWLNINIYNAAKLTKEKSIWRKEVNRAAYLATMNGTDMTYIS